MKKKNKTMKKTGFITGAFVSTFGIVITKILGILYVIPFYAIIGDNGGALYGYAYTIYLLFMSLSSAGIPLAISKIISEYQTLGYYSAKRRAFAIGKKLALLLGGICFLVLIVFAPLIAKTVLGDLTGGNSIKDVTFVIRIISSAILVVPILSIYRGYFEGHRFMIPPSISQIIEQIIRVAVIILGSFLALKVFNLSLTNAVGIAVFGATAGAIGAYIYLVNKKLNNNKRFQERVLDTNEPIITDKQIFRKIIVYAIPFIMIDVFKSLYNYIDMVTVVKALVHEANFSTKDAEVVFSMISTWCSKFNMIVLAISTGVIVSLIPNLTASYVKKDRKELQIKINQAFQILLFFTVPMSMGISFLSKPIWDVFYGTSNYGANVLSYYIFVALFMSLFTVSISIIQGFKDYKGVFISLISGVVLKLLLNVNLIRAFYKMGLPAYYGSITASIIGFLVSFVICLIILHKKYGINYEATLKSFMDILCGSMIMILVLSLVKFIIPVYFDNRLLNVFIIIIYTLLGGLVYFIFTKCIGTVKNIFGNKLRIKAIKKSE